MRTCAALCLLSLIALPLSAAEDYWYGCVKEQQADHILSVRYKKAPAEAPCEVNYLSDGQAEQLWGASVQTGYCEAKAVEFVEQQQRWGWQCERNTGEPPRQDN